MPAMLGRRSLLAMTALATASARAAQGRSALVIGNGAYRNGIPQLANPPRDAAAIARVLTRLGFATELVLDASRGEMLSAIGRLGQQATGGDAALLFYAGHAAEVDGRNILFPVNVSPRPTTALLRDAVAFDDVIAALGARARTTLIFLDSCRDNPLGNAGGRGAAMAAKTTRSASGGLAPVRSASGMLIAFATAPGDVALDGEGEHSPFTAALLRHIETPDLEVRTMLTRVRRSVGQATAAQQVPWDNSSLENQFFFAVAPGRGGSARGPTQRTLDEAGSLGIPLPSGIDTLFFRRDEGPGSALVGVWSSGTRRFGGTGRHFMLVILQADPNAGTAAIIYGNGPPTQHSVDQNPASSARTVAQLRDTTLRWSTRSGARFVLVPIDQNEARLTVQWDGAPSPIMLRRLE